MSQKEKEREVVIEEEQQCSIEHTRSRSRSRSRQKGKQCSIEHTRSRSRQKQVEEKGGKKNFSKGRETRARSASEEVVLQETSRGEISPKKKTSRKQGRGEGEDDGYSIKTINSLNSKKNIKSTSDYDISKIGGSVKIIGTKTCPSCGGTDHQRSSSKLCMAKKKTSPPPKEQIPQQKKKRGSGLNDRRSRDNLSDGISRPHYINVGGADETFHPVVDVSDPSFIPRATKFKLTFEAEYGGKEAREPTPKHLMSKYFPFYIIDEFVQASNKYRL
jgi:hypothetical protein